MSNSEIRSKTLMRALELLSVRLDCDVSVLVRFLEGRGVPPPLVLHKLENETAGTTGMYYEVIDDPLESASGRLMCGLLDKVSIQLSALVDWYTPYGIRKREDGYCLMNKHGVKISPWVEEPKHLSMFMTDLPNRLTGDNLTMGWDQPTSGVSNESR